MRLKGQVDSRRSQIALVAAAVVVVLAAALAIAGLAAGTRAAQPEGLGEVSHTMLVVQ